MTRSEILVQVSWRGKDPQRDFTAGAIFRDCRKRDRDKPLETLWKCAPILGRWRGRKFQTVIPEWQSLGFKLSYVDSIIPPTAPGDFDRREYNAKGNSVGASTITKRDPEINWAFEGKSLFSHQNDIFGDISESERKVSLMTGAERDRFERFRDEGRVLQERKDVWIAESEDPEKVQEQLDCELPQAVRIVELLKTAVPGSRAKNALLEDVLHTLPDLTWDGDAAEVENDRFLIIEEFIADLQRIAEVLAEEDTPWTDALCYQEPFIEETEDHQESDLAEDPFDDGPLSTDLFAYHKVWDEGDGHPFLTEKEFDRCKAAIANATMLELKGIAKWLIEEKALTWEQAQEIWPSNPDHWPFVQGIYRARKEELVAIAEDMKDMLGAELRESLAHCTTTRQRRYIGAWLYAQMDGEKFNGKKPDVRFAYLDTDGRQHLWDIYRGWNQHNNQQPW